MFAIAVAASLWHGPIHHHAKPIVWLPPMTGGLILAVTKMFNRVTIRCTRFAPLILLSVTIDVVVGAVCAVLGAVTVVHFSTFLHWVEILDCGGESSPAAANCLVSTTELINDLQHMRIPVAIG